MKRWVVPGHCSASLVRSLTCGLDPATLTLSHDLAHTRWLPIRSGQVYDAIFPIEDTVSHGLLRYVVVDISHPYHIIFVSTVNIVTHDFITAISPAAVFTRGFHGRQRQRLIEEAIELFLIFRFNIGFADPQVYLATCTAV
jgi:hypothetical protein